MTAFLPVALLLTALVPAGIIFFLPEDRDRLRAVVNLTGAVLKLALVGYMLLSVMAGTVYETRFPLVPGLELWLRADALALLFISLSAFLWLLTTIYAIAYFEGGENLSRFFGFFSLCVAATVGIALAGTAITFFVFYELLTLATWPLVVHKGNAASLAAGRSYLAYTLIGIAASTQEDTRCLIGVQADGVTVCPCAQDMVRSHSRDLLEEEGFSEPEISRILEVLPVASHNQRGRGTLMIGSEQYVPAENLIHIVEASMSSETYELLKRPDEFFVVNKAHRNPRFVEDVVREMLRNVVAVYPDLPDDAFVLAKQENLESIHQHNAFAERHGTLGEIRREIIGGDDVAGQTSLEDWLRGADHAPSRR